MLLSHSLLETDPANCWLQHRRFRLLRPLYGPPTEKPGREEQDGSDQSEDRFERNPDQTKRQRQEPDERKEDQREERQRPAEDKENAPADEKKQGFHGVIFSLRAAASTRPAAWDINREPFKFSRRQHRADLPFDDREIGAVDLAVGVDVFAEIISVGPRVPILLHLPSIG